MTTFQIKLIAISTMIIDHIGALFFPQIILLRIIGRISFPLFAWLIANGARHTRHDLRYMLRLIAFALVSQVPFTLTFFKGYPFTYALNIFFTLSLGLAAILLMKRINNKFLRVIPVAALAAAATFLNTDYGSYGVLLIVLFYLFYGSWKKMLVSHTVLVAVYMLTELVQRQNVFQIHLIRPFSLIAILFVAFYSGVEGRKMKYAFYVFYPLHLVILFLLQSFI